MTRTQKRHKLMIEAAMVYALYCEMSAECVELNSEIPPEDRRRLAMENRRAASKVRDSVVRMRAEYQRRYGRPSIRMRFRSLINRLRNA